MNQVRTVFLGAILMLTMFQAGCDGCSGEEYYCDDTGCYWCDSYGCRPVDPPSPVGCRGDWECPADLPVCTTEGCTSQCEVDGDCASGLRCVEGFCLIPTIDDPPPLDSGNCSADPSVCGPGEYCSPSRWCLPVDGGNCYADMDCTGGEICDTATHLCVAPPADAGTGDDGGTVIPDATTDGPPIPTPQCYSNAECEDHYLCIDGVCKLPCRNDSECGAGCHCLGGFCSSPET